MIDQHFLEAHHVADGDDRELHRVGAAGRGVDRAGARRAAAAAEDVRAEDEVFVGVEGFAGADHVVPPAGLAFVADAGGVRVAGEGVQDQDRVRFGGVQFAVGFVGDVDGREGDAVIERDRRESGELGFHDHGWIYL